MEMRNLYKDCDLPGDVMDAPSLEVFQISWDRALEQSNEVKYVPAHISLPMTGRL